MNVIFFIGERYRVIDYYPVRVALQSVFEIRARTERKVVGVQIKVEVFRVRGCFH